MEIEKTFSWNLPYDETEDIIFSLSKGDCCLQATTLYAQSASGAFYRTSLTYSSYGGYDSHWSGPLPDACGGVDLFCLGGVFSIKASFGAICSNISGTIVSVSCSPFQVVADLVSPSSSGYPGFPCLCSGQSITLTITDI